ncbi:superfamily I DNA and RNA helicase [mine drainage metagenome]|uniref:Superfamily I DNA and RNA helicase n=1 Tax=mine drainage metagenome TaxID=410659 RepID=T0ZGA6_9ZZZZ
MEPHARFGVVGGVADLEKLLEGAAALKRGERTHVSELAEFTSWREVEEASEEEYGRHLTPLVKMVEQHGLPKLFGVVAMVRGNERDEESCKTLFSTAHKSKGREFESVMLTDDFTIRTAEADAGENGGWNVEEGNLLYVAVTRAKLSLDPYACYAATDAITTARALRTANTATATPARAPIAEL